MAVRQFSRTVVGAGLDLARVPADLVTRVLPGGPSGAQARVQLAVDKADATVRTALGALLHDDVLHEDGERRSIAAHERWRSIGLRQAADDLRDETKADLAAERADAEQQRQRAAAEAEDAREEIAERTTTGKARVAKAAAKQERAVTKAADRKKAAVDKAAKRRRLEVLEERTEALDAEAVALTATDEADRLKAEAAKAKAARKQESQAVTRP